MAKRGPKIRYNDAYHRKQRELMRKSRAKKKREEAARKRKRKRR